MIIFVNGTEMAVRATALNGEFVAQGRRDATPLAERDRVEIVAARQGG
jgi:thiamine biosynthesis protein ThiS